MDQQALQHMINQKLKEMEQHSSAEQDCQVGQLAEAALELEEAVKEGVAAREEPKEQCEWLVKVLAALQERWAKAEEAAQTLKRHKTALKNEKDGAYQEVDVIRQQKNKLQEFCLKMNEKIKEVEKFKDSFIEEETAKREDMERQFQHSIKDIVDKFAEQEEEVATLDKHNQELSGVIKDKITQYEQIQKDFMKTLEEEDQSSNSRSQSFIQRLAGIEEGAKQAFALKQQIEFKKSANQEEKMKISFYMEKGKNFENSLEKTTEMLLKFQEEMSKVGHKYRQQLENEARTCLKSSRIDQAMISLVQKTETLKAQIATLQANKATQSEECKQLQAQITAASKLINQQQS